MSRVLPILFNTDMVRAILDGRKTATRRIANGIAPYSEYGGFAANINGKRIGSVSMENLVKLKSKYYPGDILYVRETWAQVKDVPYWNKYHRLNKHPISPEEYIYRADNIKVDGILPEMKWRPSIHMPKEAARLWIKVTDVRVECLQSMTLDDFLKEGVMIRPEAFNDPENAYQQAKSTFMNIWNPTIKKSDKDRYGWDADPYTWVIEFEQCEKPEGEIHT